MSALATPEALIPAAAPINLAVIHSNPTSHSFLLPHEDKAAYEALAANYLETYRPATPGELDLVHTLHQTRWRIDRLVAVEYGLIALGLAQSLPAIDARFGELDDDTRRALAQSEGFRANARTIEQINRQESRLERLYLQTRIELEHLIDSRSAPIPSNTDTLTERAPAKPVSPAGFVPTNLIEPMPNFTGPMKDIKRKQWLRRQLKRTTEALGNYSAPNAA